ncbi:sensitivity to high expression protein she9 [Ceratobasidium sp. 423]|nr:sensitivity to high expression protein she9 [Ceratobasidium sp. 423]
MLARQLVRHFRPTSAPRLYLNLQVSRYVTDGPKNPNVTGLGKSSVAGSGTLKPEKSQVEVEADKIVKEYMDSIKPEPSVSTRNVPLKPVDEAASKSDSSGSVTSSPSPKPSVVAAPTPPTPRTPLSEKLSSDAKKAAQSLSMWKDATFSLLRSRGEETAVQLKALGGKLNKVTGYDEIEILKRKVVEKEEAITALRASARRAKEDYSNAVSTRATRQRQVNDLLQRKSSWTDNDVIAFTKLVREDHASAAAEQECKTNLERAESAVDAEFGKLTRAILDRYHEEQVWSDKIRSVSTYGSLAALVANIVVFVLALVFVEPWKRKRLAQTFENRITEMSEETRRLVEGGMKGLEEHFEKQEGVLAALAAVVRKPVPGGREELPPIEPVPVGETPSLPQPNQTELVERAKVLVESLTPSTDRDYALMAIGGLGGLIASGAIFLFRPSTR